jgi:hypothetical protein
VTPSVPPPPSPPPGSPAEIQPGLLAGTGYRLLRRLGRGAFGEVWQAEAPGGIDAAMKIIFRSLTEKEAQAERNALELTKKLRHGYLLQTHSFWTLEDRLMVAMELADGSLRDRFRECLAQGLIGIPVEELLPYIEQAAAALDYLHENRLLHRDIKPENILRLGKLAKVADFGLAMVLPETVRSVTVNSAGTIPYMGPEVWYGKAVAASDQWSLAITYVELRLGRQLFGGANQAEMMFSILSTAPDLSGLHPEEQAVVSQALAKEHTGRFPSCYEFTASLRDALAPFLPARKGSTTRTGHRTQTQVNSALGAGRQTSPATPSAALGDADLKTDPGRGRRGGAPGTAGNFDTVRLTPDSGVEEVEPAPAPTGTQPGGPGGAAARAAGARKRRGFAFVVLGGLLLGAVAGGAVWWVRNSQKPVAGPGRGSDLVLVPVETAAPAPTQHTGGPPTEPSTERPQPSTEKPRTSERPVVVPPDEVKTYAVVSLINEAGKEVRYRYKWSTETEWKDATLAEKGKEVHYLAIPEEGPLPMFEIEAIGEGGKGTFKPSKWTGKGRPTFEDGHKFNIKPDKKKADF